MTKTILIVSLLAAITLLLVPQTVMANQENNSDVSVWDSSVSSDLISGIFPIGGSGQIAGNFAVDTYTKKDTAIQVGIRAQERFIGTIEPIGDLYFVPSGESTLGAAKWNFDTSIDMGSSFLEIQLGENLSTQNLEDFTVSFQIRDNNGIEFDCDALCNAENPFGPIVLTQSSSNVGFIPGFPIDSAYYDIRLAVENSKGKALAESEITVIVSDETPENGKIDVCHKGKKTINVSVESVKTHISHGDTIGACE